MTLYFTDTFLAEGLKFMSWDLCSYATFSWNWESSKQLCVFDSVTQSFHRNVTCFQPVACSCRSLMHKPLTTVVSSLWGKLKAPSTPTPPSHNDSKQLHLLRTFCTFLDSESVSDRRRGHDWIGSFQLLFLLVHSLYNIWALTTGCHYWGGVSGCVRKYFSCQSQSQIKRAWPETVKKLLEAF